MRLFVFGFGYAGQALARRLKPKGWTIAGVRRSAEADDDVAELIEPNDRAAVERGVRDASALLIAAPPDARGCPGFRALVPHLSASAARPGWIGYLSTTGVYGDRGGCWVFEWTPRRAHSAEGARRAAAEHDWLRLGDVLGLRVAVFRLPGIYGPGRSAFDRLRAGTATRLVKPGQVFSRIHVDDLAAGLAASIRRPRAGAIYNLCDDEPAPPSDVTAYAAGLLGVDPPPEQRFDQAALPPQARRFWLESKRVSNARIKAELGWRPAYPTYREGLAAVLAAERECDA